MPESSSPARVNKKTGFSRKNQKTIEDNGYYKRRGRTISEVNQQARTLVELASQSGFAELHSLVDELHRRRSEHGITLDDYGQQAQLKTLIHLVHTYGERRVEKRKPNFKLLAGLREASIHLVELRPRGLLKTVLAAPNVSWPELLVMFGALLAQGGLERRLAPIHAYLQLQRLLYFAFANGMTRAKGEGSLGRYFLTEGDMRRLWAHVPQLEAEWPGPVPLLPLDSRGCLLSPELLYDDLLQKYLELAAYWGACYDRRQYCQVAEEP